MNQLQKGIGVGAVIAGWESPVREIIDWLIHGVATMDWSAFPEQAASQLVMLVFAFAVYRAWPQSVRTPPEPKA